MKRTLAVLASLALSASPALATDVYTVDKVHSEASFQIRHMMSKVRGRFGDFTGTIKAEPGKPDASSVEFTIKAASINTDNENRDKDLRSPNFFDVAKYPDITFKSSKVVSKGQDKYDVTGTLAMHGVSKEITLPVSFLGSGKDPWGGERAGFETSITLNRKDFGLTWNKALEAGGLLLGDEVSVSINLETKKEAPAK
jgi:polyisoprenoid-binding protein YceI